MPVLFDLQQLPKQQFTIALENVLWDISLLETNGVMSANITRGGDPQAVVKGWRCVAGQMIIPKNREAGGGNFLFLTATGDLPWWEEFGVTQLLLYASAAEIATVRNGN